MRTVSLGRCACVIAVREFWLMAVECVFMICFEYCSWCMFVCCDKHLIFRSLVISRAWLCTNTLPLPPCQFSFSVSCHASNRKRGPCRCGVQRRHCLQRICTLIQPSLFSTKDNHTFNAGNSAPQWGVHLYCSTHSNTLKYTDIIFHKHAEFPNFTNTLAGGASTPARGAGTWQLGAHAPTPFKPCIPFMSVKTTTRKAMPVKTMPGTPSSRPRRT
jgi:hypothetical protein